MAMSTLRQRLVSGARWTIAIRVVERLIGFITTLILARLLAPADFGVIAMGTAIQGILASLTEFGFTKGLIRMRRPDSDAYSTAFSLHLITTTLVALAMLALIPVAMAWYDDARVAPVLVTLAAISLISGFRNFGLARYERALDFRPFFVIALARKLASFAVGVAVAVLWGDYRALLAGMFAGTLVEVAATYRVTRFRPRFTLARSKELLGFSAWLLATEVAAVLGGRGQDLLVGQRLGATALGQYAVALDLATMPTAEIVAPVMRAVYPGYMQMKDDVGRLFSAFVRVWGAIALLALPSAVGTACLADLISRIVLGPKWVGASPLIASLAVLGALQALYSCFWPMILTRRGPKTIFLLTAFRVGISVPAFGAVLWLFGLLPAIGAWIACWVLVILAAASVLLKDLDGTSAPLLKGMVRPALSVVVMAASLGAMQAILPATTTIPGGFAQVLLLIASGAAVYGGSVICLWLVAGRPVGAETELLNVVMSRVRPQSVATR
jgi:O-antigen/teichoic acid export membrane protein